MESTVVVPNVSEESALDTGVIIAELHQTEKIETVVVTGDFIELGSSYETGEQAVACVGSEEAQVLEVITVQPDDGVAAENGTEVSENCKLKPGFHYPSSRAVNSGVGFTHFVRVVSL